MLFSQVSADNLPKQEGADNVPGQEGVENLPGQEGIDNRVDTTVEVSQKSCNKVRNVFNIFGNVNR